MGKRKKTPMSLYLPDGPVLTYLKGCGDNKNEAVLELMTLGLAAKLAGSPQTVNVTPARVNVTVASVPQVAQDGVNVSDEDKPFNPGWDDDP